jgi:hypothetical protein
MHIIKAHEPPVTLFSRDGEVRVFKSLSDALKQLGMSWIRENVAAEFVDFLHVERFLRFDEAKDRSVWDRQPVYRTAHYVMRDDTGAKLTQGDFQKLVVTRRRSRWARYSRPLDTWNGEGPVPGIGRWHGGHYYRRLKTTNERRQAVPVDDEPAPRGKRSASNIPQSWDDHPIGTWGVRSWKRFRRQQWKA